MLRDTASLAGHHVGISDVVQEFGFTVVHVTHDGDDRSARHEVFLAVDFFRFGDGLLHIGADEVDLEAELFGHHAQGFSVEALVDGNRHTEAHAGADDFHHRHIHHGGQFVCRNKFRHLQDFLVLFLAHHLLHHVACHLLTLFAAVLGGFRLAHRSQASQSVLDLLRDFLVGQFHLFLALRLLLVFLAWLDVVFLVFLVGIVAALRFLSLALLLVVAFLRAWVHVGSCRVFRRAFGLALDAFALFLARFATRATFFVGKFNLIKDFRAFQFLHFRLDELRLDSRCGGLFLFLL